MTRYAKINDNGTLEYAPRDMPGISNWIEDETAVLAAGFLPVAAEEQNPSFEHHTTAYRIEGGYIIPYWVNNPFTREEISRRREEQYDSMADKLTKEYMRKSLLGILSDVEKENILLQLREISEVIVNNNPYPSEDCINDGGENG